MGLSGAARLVDAHEARDLNLHVLGHVAKNGLRGAAVRGGFSQAVLCQHVGIALGVRAGDSVAAGGGLGALLRVRRVVNGGLSSGEGRQRIAEAREFQDIARLNLAELSGRSEACVKDIHLHVPDILLIQNRISLAL